MASVIDLPHGGHLSQPVMTSSDRRDRRHDSISSSTDTAYSISSTAKLKQPHTAGHIKFLYSVECLSEVLCCKFSPKAALYAAGLANGVVKIFQMDNGSCVYELSDDDTKQSRLPCTSLHFIPTDDKEKTQNLLLATYASGMVKLWHFTTGACLHTTNEARQSLCSTVSGQRDKYATAGSDPRIHIYDVQTKTKLTSLEPSDSRDVMNGHRMRVHSVKYHPTDSHMLISGGWDDTVQFWDDRTQHAVRRIYGPHICGDGIDIDAVHNHLMTGSWRKGHELQIWDVESGNKLKDIPQDALHQCMLYCCQWLGQEHIICGGNDQNMIRIIDRGTLNTVAQVVDFESGVFCVDHDKSSHHHPKIVVGSSTSLHLFKQEKR